MDRRNARIAVVWLGLTALVALAPANADAQVVDAPTTGASDARAEADEGRLELHIQSADALAPTSERTRPTFPAVRLVPRNRWEGEDEARRLRRLTLGRTLMVASVPALVSGPIVTAFSHRGNCAEQPQTSTRLRRAAGALLGVGVTMTFTGVSAYVSVPRDFRRDHPSSPRRERWIRVAPVALGSVSLVATALGLFFPWVGCIPEE